MTRCAFRPLVDRHFGAKLGPREESSLRAHLPTCERCHHRYERWLHVARLDPAIPSAEQRLAAGLGLSLVAARPGPLRSSFPRFSLLAAAAVAACLAFLLLRPHEPWSGLQARGVAGEPRVWVYRVSAGAPPVELGEVMSASDELAFAYDNPSVARRLLLFGVDEHRHVYWYHPAWLDPATTPTAVPAAPGRHELPEAVAHHLDGSVLTLYAVFTDQGVTVRDVEREVDAYTHRAAWMQRVRVAR